MIGIIYIVYDITYIDEMKKFKYSIINLIQKKERL